MTTSVTHPLARTLVDAALGQFPAPDRRAEVVSPPPGPADAVAIYNDHVVVAADVDEGWVNEQLQPHWSSPAQDPSGGMTRFIEALARHLGNPPMYASIVTVGPYKASYLRGEISEGGRVDPGWAAYHSDIRTYRYTSHNVTASIGFGWGTGGRWDLYLEVEDGKPGDHARELLVAAKSVVPDEGLLFGSAPLHDPRALRMAVSSGFQPVCTEVLFLTRP